MRTKFEEHDVLGKLTMLGDPLEKLEKVIDWEIFRPTLNSVFEK
ncbi:MAG: IS5 family transposase, partial [Culicoidibacterales bacterium]